MKTEATPRVKLVTTVMAIIITIIGMSFLYGCKKEEPTPPVTNSTTSSNIISNDKLVIFEGVGDMCDIWISVTKWKDAENLIYDTIYEPNDSILMWGGFVFREQYYDTLNNMAYGIVQSNGAMSALAMAFDCVEFELNIYVLDENNLLGITLENYSQYNGPLIRSASNLVHTEPGEIDENANGILGANYVYNN